MAWVAEEIEEDEEATKTFEHAEHEQVRLGFYILREVIAS